MEHVVMRSVPGGILCALGILGACGEITSTSPAETSTASTPTNTAATQLVPKTSTSGGPVPEGTTDTVPSPTTVPGPFGDGKITLRLTGVVRKPVELPGPPQFCLRVGEDGGGSCIGGPALEITGELPSLDWDRASDDLVWLAEGTFDLEIEGRQVDIIRPVELPTSVIELIAGREYALLIERFPEFVASPEIIWIEPQLLRALPPDRRTLLAGDGGDTTELDFDAYYDQLYRELQTEYPDRYFELSFSNEEATMVMIVGYDPSAYAAGVERARRGLPGPHPELLIVSMAPEVPTIRE